MNGGLSVGSYVAVPHGAQQAEGVFSCIVRQFRPGDLRHGCQQICVTDGVVTLRSGVDDLWPARNKGDAVTAFKDVGFVSADSQIPKDTKSTPSILWREICPEADLAHRSDVWIHPEIH